MPLSQGFPLVHWNLPQPVFFGIVGACPHPTRMIRFLNHPALRWRTALLSLAGLLSLYLIFSAKPWTIDLVSRHRVGNFWAVYSWYAAGMGILVSTGLAAIAPWWAGRAVQSSDRAPSVPRFFWLAVVMAMGVAAFFSVPRMTFGLWDDEELNVRKSILGKFKQQEPGGPASFQPLKWQDTLLEYREPNNHVLNSLLARGCHEIWRAAAKPGGLPFTEWALRVPAFVAGVCSVATLAWMLLVFGMPRAAVVAAFLAALHPWFVRYTSECRGYAFALLLVPLIFGLWHRAVFRGRWKWWAALAAAQFAMIYAYPGTLFVLVALNLVALPVLYYQHGAAQPFVAQSGRWFCVNALVAIPALILLLPLLAQVGPYIKGQSEQGFVMGGQWIWNELHYFLGGVAWSRNSTAQAAYPEVVFQLGDWLWLYFAMMAVVAAFLLAGIVRFARMGPMGWSILITVFVPPLLTYGFSVIKTQIIYEAYIIYALPGLIALVAAGSTKLVDTVPGMKTRPVAANALLVVLVLAYAGLTHQTRSWLSANPLQQLPESVLATRGSLDPWNPSQQGVLTASFCIPPYLYDPHMVRLDRTAELVDLIKSAESSGKPLFVNIGMPWAASQYSPGMWALVNDSDLFEAPVRFAGWDPGLDRLVFALKPGASNGYDFSPAMRTDR